MFGKKKGGRPPLGLFDGVDVRCDGLVLEDGEGRVLRDVPDGDVAARQLSARAHRLPQREQRVADQLVKAERLERLEVLLEVGAPRLTSGDLA